MYKNTINIMWHFIDLSFFKQPYLTNSLISMAYTEQKFVEESRENKKSRNKTKKFILLIHSKNRKSMEESYICQSDNFQQHAQPH